MVPETPSEEWEPARSAHFDTLKHNPELLFRFGMITIRSTEKWAKECLRFGFVFSRLNFLFIFFSFFSRFNCTKKKINGNTIHTLLIFFLLFSAVALAKNMVFQSPVGLDESDKNLKWTLNLEKNDPHFGKDMQNGKVFIMNHMHVIHTHKILGGPINHRATFSFSFLFELSYTQRTLHSVFFVSFWLIWSSEWKIFLRSRHE